MPWRAAAGATVALALLASSAGAEVRVELLPDGTRVVRNLPAGEASGRTAPAAAPARSVVATPSRASTAPTELRRLVAEAAAREGVDSRLVEAVVRAESGWNPAALSAKGAMGLMQLMPATAAELTVTDPWDAAENVRGGVRYLRGLLDRFEHLEHAVAAYNAGPGAVERHGGVPPYAETRAYVRRVLALYDGRQADLGVGLGARGPAPRLVQAADGHRLLTNTAGSTNTAVPTNTAVSTNTSAPTNTMVATKSIVPTSAALRTNTAVPASPASPGPTGDVAAVAVVGAPAPGAPATGEAAAGSIAATVAAR